MTDTDDAPRCSPALIELRLESVSALFDPYDPVPLPTRDLAPAVESFIAGWARELPAGRALAIRIHLPEGESEAGAAHLRLAVSRHFESQAQRMRGDRNQLLREGQVSLVIGLAVLAVCMLARQTIHAVADGPLSDIAGEALLILGSVANWRPLEIFLYDWWPIDRKRRLFERLARADIGIVAHLPEVILQTA